MNCYYAEEKFISPNHYYRNNYIFPSFPSPVRFHLLFVADIIVVMLSDLPLQYAIRLLCEKFHNKEVN